VSFALRLFPPARELPTCSSSLRALVWCLLFKLGSIRYILHLENMFLFALFAPPGSLSPLVLALKFSACYCWSYSSCDVVHACSFFYHGYLRAPYAKCGNKTPVKHKNWIFLGFSLLIRCICKRKPERKDPDSSEIPYFRALNY
jgi:hypothetical protein